ncbi:GGDEF domain-containing protein [Spirillospora albida]|uniref:GGDEF domain-containing protein n=1 Tax=Spirillospora albida TaxID=58123 RepID=UPI000690068B|nr:GGDEF domain-containing protein [Spirillospora albida]
MSVGRLRILVTATLVLAVLDAVLYSTSPGNVLHLALYAAICGLAWWAAVRLAPARDRPPWLLIASALTLWMAGDVIEVLSLDPGTPLPVIGASDALWLSGYPLVAAAVFLMARRRAPGRLRAGLLDALTVTVAAALASWQFFVEPFLSGGFAEAVVPALYVVCDIVLLAAGLLLALSADQRGTPIRRLLCAVSLYLAVDLGYNLLPYVLGPQYVEKLGAALLLGHVVLISALLHPARAELTRPAPPSHHLHPARLVFLHLALWTIPVLFLSRTGLTVQGYMTAAASALCATFVLGRFTSAVRELERVRARLVDQASSDPLTGLPNRSALHDHLRHVMRTGGVAVLYLDLDGFKQINDAHGHEAGDTVLMAVAERLSSAVRETDVAARLGGDEFALLCPGLSHDNAVALARRLLHQIAEPVPFHGQSLHVGASIGIALHHAGTSETSPLLMLRAADTAMYTAKREGLGWSLAEPIPG